MNIEMEKYLLAVPAERKARLNQIHLMILDLYPDAIVDMGYKMPTCRVGDGWVAFANQKRYLSVYTCSYHHIGPFKAKYPRIKTGKGCINFRDNDELPLSNLRTKRGGASHNNLG